MKDLICSRCHLPFVFDDILSSDEPMCERCAEEEWRQLQQDHGDLHRKERKEGTK